MRLAILTSRDLARGHPDDRSLFDALARRGVEPLVRVWDDPAIDWPRHDAMLVRTPWDYYRRWDEFSAFLAAIEQVGLRTINPIATLRWNADKRYLVELAAAGLPVVPTRLVERGDPVALEHAISAVRGSGVDVVVKPTISGGAWRTWRFGADGPGALRAELDAALAAGALLVQPYLDAVARAGEWSLLFFAGRYSHALLKRPRSGDFRVQESHGGTHSNAEPDAALRAAAQRVVDALPALGHPGVLYARVDGVVDDGAFRLMELEVFEPQLFLDGRPAAAARFADVIAGALRG